MKNYRSEISAFFMTSDPNGSHHVVIEHSAFESDEVMGAWTPLWTRYVTRKGHDMDRISETEFVVRSDPTTVFTVNRIYLNDCRATGTSLVR